MIFTETGLKGAYVIDVEPHEDVEGFFCSGLLSTRVRGSRFETGHRAGKRGVQQDKRDITGHAFSDPPRRGDQAGALHTRGDPRHNRGFAARIPDLPAAYCSGAERRQPPEFDPFRSGSRTAIRCSSTKRRRATTSGSSTVPPTIARFAITIHASD